MDDLRPRYTIAVHPEAFSPDVQAAAEKGALVGVDIVKDDSLPRFAAEIRVPGAPPIRCAFVDGVFYDLRSLEAQIAEACERMSVESKARWQAYLIDREVERGRKAFREGLPASANPNVERNFWHFCWNSGWKEAKKAALNAETTEGDPREDR